uniref:Uncharacterized protein n=1 Tax=Rhizophora mucronata TaxID=61149 RepID=A0A2P2N206_RHIMU
MLSGTVVFHQICAPVMIMPPVELEISFMEIVRITPLISLRNEKN